MELRCDHKLHAIVVGDLPDSTVVEVSCDSRFCGSKAGVAIRHRFQRSGESVVFSTQRYKILRRKATT